MCLAIPYTIKEIYSDGSAKAFSNNVGMEIRLDLIDSPLIGDVVLVHAGFAIQKLEKGESEELAALWDEINEAAQHSYSVQRMKTDE